MVTTERQLGYGLAACLSMYLEPDRRTILTELIEDYCKQVAQIGSYPKAFVFEKVITNRDLSQRTSLNIVFQNGYSPEKSGSLFGVSRDWMKLASKDLTMSVCETGYQDPRRLRYSMIRNSLESSDTSVKQLWEGSLV